jgi:hypothetical protein
MTQPPDQQPSAEQFLVKNWNFRAANIPANNISILQPYTHFNKVDNPATGNSQYRWIGNPAVIYTVGTPAQNNPTPPGAFRNHQVVLINGKLYDPSYGRTYPYDPLNPKQAFANAALDGRVVVIPFDERRLNFDLDGDGVLDPVYEVALFGATNLQRIDFT